MSAIHAEASAIINARPEEVYALLADYHHGHSSILPAAFSSLEIEKGGIGAGTVFSATTKMMGIERILHMEVSEPEPGRVMVEKETKAVTPMTTTFTFDPSDDGQKTNLKIETDREGGKGLMGMIEGLMIPAMLKGLYQKELQLIAQAFDGSAKPDKDAKQA